MKQVLPVSELVRTQAWVHPNGTVYPCFLNIGVKLGDDGADRNDYFDRAYQQVKMFGQSYHEASARWLVSHFYTVTPEFILDHYSSFGTSGYQMYLISHGWVRFDVQRILCNESLITPEQIKAVIASEKIDEKAHNTLYGTYTRKYTYHMFFEDLLECYGISPDADGNW